MYKGELNGEKIDLDEIFVENSEVIKGMLEICEKEEYLPLIYDDMDKNILDNSVKLLKSLVDRDRRSIKFRDEYMVDSNIEEISRILNMSNFYDIKVLEDYLVDFFANRIRSCKNEDDLKLLFEQK